jgi:putative colanic acid biosynthesis acetyltransferase WcaB
MIIDWLSNLKTELKANPIPKSKIVIFIFRLSTLRHHQDLPAVLRPLMIIWVGINYLFLDLLLNIELRATTKIGWGLVIYHASHIVVHPNAVIGDNCIMRHGLTIGNKFDRKTSMPSDCPAIGDNVEFGAYALVIGPIIIESGATIGAMALVDFDVEENRIVVGNRGHILLSRRTDPEKYVQN